MKRFLRYFRGRRFESDLDAEMQAHLEEKIDEFTDEGLPPEHAREQALRQFGNRTRCAERSREQWTFESADEIVQDLRYAARILRKNPVFTTVAVLSLGLGVGANTIVFSAVHHVLLSSLPYPQAEKLYAVWSRSASKGVEPMHVSAADYYDWRAQTRAFHSLAAYASWPMNLTNVDEPRRLETQLVSASFFTTLGVHAQLGRTFLADEDQEQSRFVVVLSHHLWRALGESPQILGQQVTLNGSPATVVGVMPASFAFPSRETDAWVPLSLSAQNRTNREGRWLKVIGRLDAKATPRSASTEMEVISRRLAAAYPASNTGWSVWLTPLQEEVVGKTRPILLTLQAVAALLLLITCVNLANLLLAKSASRTREIGLRAALGASRGRILRQLIVESAVLASVGGGLGLALAIQGIALLRRFGGGLIPRAAEIRLSPEVALFAAAATSVTALIFGLAPALHASRLDLRSHIGSGGRGTPRSVERRRGLFVTIEVGLASLLLVGAGLLGESLAHLVSVAPGIRTDHALTVRLTLSRSKYPNNAAQNAVFDEILARVESQPGVLAAAEISDTPLEGNNPTFEFALDGVARDPASPPIQAGLRAISAGYSRTAGIPLLKGRDFTRADGSASQPVAIINETMARQFWPGSDPMGKKVRLKEDPRWITVAGIIRDIKHMGLRADEGPVVYIPYAQKTQEWLAWTTLLIRTAGEPTACLPQIRQAIRSVDKNQPVGEVSTLETSLAHSIAIPRFTASVIGVASGLALLIALIGVYGLLAYTVAQRMPELGIRLTLGASPFQISWLLLRRAMLDVLSGVAGGLLAAWWLTNWLRSQLFDVQPHDATTFVGVAVLLAVASLAAVLGPARRSAKIDPVTALRAE